MQTTWAWSYYHADPTFIVLITKTNVLWIAGLSLLLFPQERGLIKSPRFWAGLVLSGAGVTGVVLSGRDGVTVGHHIGTIIALICALFHAFYALAVRIAFRDIDSRQGFSIVSIYTALALWIPALCLGKVHQCLTMGAFAWLCVILSAITAIAIGHTLYYLAIRYIGATIPSLVILVQPFVVLVISRFVFSEVLTTAQILFGLILLVGAALAIWAQQDLRRG
jgi:drug/metabolite transporter (DMT)-like permease